MNSSLELNVLFIWLLSKLGYGENFSWFRPGACGYSMESVLTPQATHKTMIDLLTPQGYRGRTGSRSVHNWSAWRLSAKACTTHKCTWRQVCSGLTLAERIQAFFLFFSRELQREVTPSTHNKSAYVAKYDPSKFAFFVSRVFVYSKRSMSVRISTL